jgi:DNA-binding transcriptional ArsR family regulator
MSELPLQTISSLSDGPRSLLQLILDYVAADIKVPQRSELAQKFGVDVRTIDRWLRQLRDYHLLAVPWKEQRRNVYVPFVRDRKHNDQRSMIADHCEAKNYDQRSHPKTPLERQIKTRSAILSSGGGGVHDSDHGSPPITEQREKPKPCSTKLGKFLAANGFGVAREFDNRAAAGELNEDRYIGYTRKALEDRVPHHRIVHLLRLGAPDEEATKPAGAYSSDYVQQLKQQFGDLFVTDEQEGAADETA